MKRNTLLIHSNKNADYIKNGMVFKVENTDSYGSALDEIKHKLETPEMVNYIIDINDMTYKLNQGGFQFVEVASIGSQLYDFAYLFQNDKGDEEQIGYNMDFVYIAE